MYDGADHTGTTLRMDLLVLDATKGVSVRTIAVVAVVHVRATIVEVEVVRTEAVFAVRPRRPIFAAVTTSVSSTIVVTVTGIREEHLSNFT